MTVFLRLLNDTDKKIALNDAINSYRESAETPSAYEAAPHSFGKIPGSPFAYWVSEKLKNLFSELSPFEHDDRMARAGLQSSDDFRFLRANWEVPSHSPKWIYFAKGGKYSPFYADIKMKINWHSDGYEIKAWAGSLYNGSHWSRIIKNTHLYFRPGMFQTLRANKLAPHITPAGCIFSDNGTQAFSSMGNIMSITAILNSSAADFLHKLLLGRNGYGLYRNGTLAKLPMPDLNDNSVSLSEHAVTAWSVMRRIDEVEETSNAFILPKLLLNRIDGFDKKSEEIKFNEAISKIDEIVYDMYGFDFSDIASTRIGIDEPSVEIADDTEYNAEGTGESEFEKDGIHGLLSWSVGVVFGRFDWRLATAERAPLIRPGPFDQLPAKSNAMLPNDAVPFHYNTGFLVDDPGHPYDLGRLIEDLLQKINIAVPVFNRQWLRKDFFADHLQQYSQSKRKAPIYWRLSTASGSYSIWLYALAVTKDTFFRVQHDILQMKISSEERKLADLSQTNSERIAIEKQQDLVDELKQLVDEVKRVAPLWDPNLDDGTVLVMAPLWRMVGHHKQWQKELRTRWEELQSGKHEWSHQAMHLWPERVVPKCAEDRSLAIAHDLEDVFWFEAESGKWARRDVPTHSVDEIVRERTSDAVKAALKELLEAPEPAATGSRSRRRA